MSRRRHKRRLLTRFAWSLLAVFVFITLATVITVNSETASRSLLRQATGMLGIESGRISGTLAAGLSLEQLRYRNGVIDISVGKLDVNWEPWALLYVTCKIRSLRAEDVRIRYAPASGKPASSGETWLRDLSLPLKLALEAGEIRGLQIDYDGRDIAVDRMLLDGALSSRLMVNRLSIEAPTYHLTAQGSIDSGFPFAGEIAMQWGYNNASFKLAGAGRVSGDIRRLEVDHTLSLPGTLTTRGSLTGLAEGAPQAELHNRWHGLRPPLIPFPLDSDGELDAIGWLNDYRLLGQGSVQSPDLPPLKISLQAGGDRGGLHNTSIQVQALSGTIGIKGSMAWLPAFEWNTDVNATDIDLRSVHPQLPEKLRLYFHSAGARGSGQWSGRLDNIRGDGSLHSRALSLKGALEFNGDAFKSPGLELTAAENSLSLSGAFDRRRIDAEWRLRALRLAALWPGLAGTLNADGRVSGGRNSPRLTATLSGDQLAYDKYRVGSLHATLASTDRQQYALNVGAERITFDERTASTFSLSARGNTAAHRIESRLQDDALGANLVIEGAYQNKRWHGRLLDARLQPARLPAWSLQQPMAISYGGGIRFETACWSADTARICAELDAAAKGPLRGKATLSAVPVGLLDTWLGPRVTLNGLIDGTLNLGGTRMNPSATLDLKADAGTIGIRREGMPADDYRWEKAALRAELRERRLTGSTELSFPGYGAAQGNFTVQLRSRQLEGNINARFHNLAPLQTLVPELAELNGILETSLKLGGTLARPAISGSLLLADASARIPRWGIGINALRLDARGEPGGKITFEGSAASGPGQLRLDGTLAWGKAPALEAHVGGENFEILHLPTIQARLSPDLDIRAGPGHMDVQGEVRIPSAHMNIKTLPESAVKVSPDAVLADEAAHARAHGDFRLSSQLRLILGDDVQFEGFGFNTGLDGQLVLSKLPGRPLAAHGELTVRQGQYKAFGQQLDIERGRLLFQGPYDNPGLDIAAMRKTPDVSVHLEIGGTLENPESRVYSEPPLPDSEAMAILLTGKPLGSASETDANALVGAVAALGMKKGKFITDDIARTLNLDEFNIQSEGDVSKSSLFIGKRISPRLFIRYIVGLFDQTSRIGLSYQLSRNLKIEAESGWVQSMDLIYEIER